MADDDGVLDELFVCENCDSVAPGEHCFVCCDVSGCRDCKTLAAALAEALRDEGLA